MKYNAITNVLLPKRKQIVGVGAWEVSAIEYYKMAKLLTILESIEGMQTKLEVMDYVNLNSMGRYIIQLLYTNKALNDASWLVGEFVRN